MRLFLRQFFGGIVFQKNRLEKRGVRGNGERSRRSLAVHSLNNPHKRMVILRETPDDFTGKVLPENEPGPKRQNNQLTYSKDVVIWQKREKMCW